MSWSTPENLVQLIQTARLDGTVPPAARKAADLELLDLFEHAVNIGDSLVAITVNAQCSFALRFNAVLALEALFTQRGWKEGHQFSDKDTTLVALTRLMLNEESAASLPKLQRAATDCVCAIAVLDYPTDLWTAFIHERATDTVAAPTTSGAQGTAGSTVGWYFMHQLSRVAYRNAQLWWYLSNEVSSSMTATGFPPSSSPTCVPTLLFLLHILLRRPRPSEENELATPQNCFLLSPAFSHAVVTALEQCAATVAAHCQSSASLPPDVVVHECGLLAGLAQRLMRSADVANAAFRACACVLVAVQPYYSSGALTDVDTSTAEETGGLVANCLDCILSALQTFPEVSASSSATELLGCLLFYMVDKNSVEESLDAGELENTLKELIADDEAVPLGCEGGDDASIACSVLELFLEANHEQLYGASRALLDFAHSQLGVTPPQPAVWRALSRALTCIARVCEDADISYVNALPHDHLADLLSTFSNALTSQASPATTCLLLYAISKCFALGGPPALLAGWHAVLSSVFDLWAPRSLTSNPECQYVLCTVLWALGSVLGATTDIGWLGATANDSLLQWRSRSLSVMSAAQSPLVVSTVGRTMLQLTAVTTFSPPAFEDWSLACRSAVSACTVKAVSALLKDILSTSLELDARAPAASRVAPRLASATLQMAGHVDLSRAALVLRAIALFAVELVREGHRGAAELAPFLLFLRECTARLIPYCTDDACLSDEATIRALAVALTATQVALPDDVLASYAAVSYDAVAHAALGALAALCPVTVVHTLGSALAVQAVTYPTHLARGATGAFFAAVFGVKNWLSAARPVAGFTGCTLLFSLWVLQDPSRCVEVVATEASRTRTGGQRDALPQVATPAATFGWWATLAVFSDETCVVYFLAACVCVLAFASRAAPDVAATFSAPLPSNSVYVLPSFRSRKATNVHRGMSVWASVACGLTLVHRKWLKATKVPSNDALTLTGHATASAWDALQRHLTDAGLPAPTQASATAVVDTAALLCDHMRHSGLVDVVAAAEQLVV